MRLAPIETFLDELRAFSGFNQDPQTTSNGSHEAKNGLREPCYMFVYEFEFKD